MSRFAGADVDVRYVDDASGETLGAATLASERLPDSFLVPTTMRLGGVDWSVVAAEPAQREGFQETRKLLLRLRRLEALEPQNVLFSLPSVDNALPADGERANGWEVTLIEDDWRQCELVSVRYCQQIEHEFSAIGRVSKQHRSGPGFNAVHVRKKIAVPIPESLNPWHLTGRLGSEGKPFRFDGHGSRVRGGFAYALSGGWTVYGCLEDGGIAVLGLKQGEGHLDERAVEYLEHTCLHQGLVLVDWCRMAAAVPGESLTTVLGR